MREQESAIKISTGRICLFIIQTTLGGLILLQATVDVATTCVSDIIRDLLSFHFEIELKCLHPEVFKYNIKYNAAYKLKAMYVFLAFL